MVVALAWRIRACTVLMSAPDEIGSDDLRIRGRVRDNHDLRWPCEHVDADPPVKDTLRLRHILVAGAD